MLLPQGQQMDYRIQHLRSTKYIDRPSDILYNSCELKPISYLHTLLPLFNRLSFLPDFDSYPHFVYALM